MTTLETRTTILSQLWLDYRNNEQFADLFEYNDLGFPISYLIASQMVEPTPNLVKIVDETWEVFLTSLDLEDVDGDGNGWVNLRDVFTTAEVYNNFKLEE